MSEHIPDGDETFVPFDTSLPPRHLAEPAPEEPPVNARRSAMMAGAGGLALAGLAVTGLASLLGGRTDNPSQAPLSQTNAGGAQPARLAEPVLGSPSASPSPAEAAASAAPTAEPSPAPAGGGTPGGASGDAALNAGPQPATERAPSAERGQKPSWNRRVVHDPQDTDMSVSSVQAEDASTTAESNQEASPRYAESESATVYRSAPPAPSLEGRSPFAPNLTLRTTPAWHLARRAAIGVSAEIVAEIEALGETAWIERQLNPASIDDSWADQVVERYFPWAGAKASSVMAATRQSFKVGPQLVNSLLARSRYTNRVLLENVVDTLANHIYVPAMNKAAVFVGELDQLLRDRALGRYADLLHAVLTHPALLIEMDNQVNTKVNPNENLGRELLELYTVGVGHYDETDVRHSTLLLTGHGVDWKTGSYAYTARYHHTGALKVMGFRDANATPEGGPRVLRDYVEYLAKHQGTAYRLARRFAVRFISDEPKKQTVEQLARVYLDNDTSIKALVRATLTHPDFAAAVGQKWRRPHELISSISRAAQVRQVTPPGRLGSGREYDVGLYGWLVRLSLDLPRDWPAVDGYPDTGDYWNSASITLNMLNATQDATIGDRNESGRTSWSGALSIKAGDNAIETAKRITWHLTGYAWPDDALAAVAFLLMGETTATDTSTIPGDDLDYWASQAVRLIFASPYSSLR